MGRKGVSKRKPKQSGTSSKANSSGSSNKRSGDHSQVQSLVKDKGAPLNSGVNRSTGSKTQNKR